MKEEYKINKDQEYFDKNDIVIEKTQEITKPVETVTTSMTYGDIKNKLTALKEARIAKVEAIDKQIAETEQLLADIEKDINKVKISTKEEPESPHSVDEEK